MAAAPTCSPNPYCAPPSTRPNAQCALPNRQAEETIMFAYYLRLGFRSLRRNPVLTALMVLTLGIGIAASMSTLTVLVIMSGNPIPDKSDRLLVPLLDNNPATFAAD